jgi:fructose/tagatose bisphosphate aldolase
MYKEIHTGTNPVDFVFHGGSGSTLEEKVSVMV